LSSTRTSKETDVLKRIDQGRRDARLVIGLGLVLIGAVVLVSRAMGADLTATIAEAGWPFFLIIPGLGLLAASPFPVPPRGQGLAIAGAIVTTTGTMLLVMDQTGRYAAWAYAWALIPGGAGIGALLYGLFARQRELIANGLRLIVLFALLFAIGAWFFETTFATGRAPLDLATWWPAILVGVGAIVIVGGLVRASPRPTRGGTR
jgi:hypothetical protein